MSNVVLSRNAKIYDKLTFMAKHLLRRNSWLMKSSYLFIQQNVIMQFLMPIQTRSFYNSYDRSKYMFCKNSLPLKDIYFDNRIHFQLSLFHFKKSKYFYDNEVLFLLFIHFFYFALSQEYLIFELTLHDCIFDRRKKGNQKIFMFVIHVFKKGKCNKITKHFVFLLMNVHVYVQYGIL